MFCVTISAKGSSSEKFPAFSIALNELIIKVSNDSGKYIRSFEITALNRKNSDKLINYTELLAVTRIIKGLKCS